MEALVTLFLHVWPLPNYLTLSPVCTDMMPYWQIISNFIVIKSTVEIFKYMQMCRISSNLFIQYIWMNRYVCRYKKAVHIILDYPPEGWEGLTVWPECFTVKMKCITGSLWLQASGMTHVWSVSCVFVAPLWLQTSWIIPVWLILECKRLRMCVSMCV